LKLDYLRNKVLYSAKNIEINTLQFYTIDMGANKRIFSKKKPRELGLLDVSANCMPPKNSTQNLPNSEIEKEFGGYDGPEPTRFGDWEHNGRCTDF